MAIIHELIDAIATPATAYEMQPGDYFFGFLERDIDWIAVDLEAGQTYSFAMVGIGNELDDLYDSILLLNDGQGDVVASDDDSGPYLSSSLTFTVQDSGRYFVHAGSAGFQTGPYGISVTEGERPSFDPTMAAAALYRFLEFWEHTRGERVTVTWGFLPDGMTETNAGEPVPRLELTDAQKAAVTLALSLFGQVCNVTFQQVAPGGTTTDADLRIGSYDMDDGTAGYAFKPKYGDPWFGEGVEIRYNNNSLNLDPSANPLQPGSPSFFTVMHEIGHALGLAHPGDYAAGEGEKIKYDTHAQFIEDSYQGTVMSYFRPVNTEPTLEGWYPDTPMLYDVMALQALYGANLLANVGNSVYGFRSNVGGVFNFRLNTDPMVCIWDAGGKDTINVSGFSADQSLNLQDGTFSDVGGVKGNLSIAFGAEIENAIGGSGADAITGNRLDNALRGQNGNDTLSGDAGSDVLDGGRGNDRLNGGEAEDTFVFREGYGRDVIVDFHDNVDTIRLDQSMWGGGLSVRDVLFLFAREINGDVRIGFVDDVLVIHDMQLSMLRNDLQFI